MDIRSVGRDITTHNRAFCCHNNAITFIRKDQRQFSGILSIRNISRSAPQLYPLLQRRGDRTRGTSVDYPEKGGKPMDVQKRFPGNRTYDGRIISASGKSRRSNTLYDTGFPPIEPPNQFWHALRGAVSLWPAYRRNQ